MKPKPKEKSTGAKSHSRISPSMLSALKACPGYESDHKSSAASDRGEKMHAVQETGIADETLEKRDQDTAMMVLSATRLFDARSEYEPLKELELDFRSLDIAGLKQGTLDRAIILDVTTNESGEETPTSMAALDFKFGQWEVDEVPKNIQFRTYTLGLWLMFPLLEDVEYILHQPAHDLHESYTFRRSRDFDMIVTQVRAIAHRRNTYLKTRDPEMLNSHPDYCTFCVAQATCPVWQAYMVKLANESNCLAAPVVPLESLESPDTADEEELIRAMRWIRPMEEYLKKLKRFALAVYDTGRLSSDQITITEKDGTPKIIDPIRVGEILEERYGIGEGEYRAACSISTTEIRRLVSDHSKTGEKTQASDEAIAILEEEGLIERGETIRYVGLRRASKRKI